MKTVFLFLRMEGHIVRMKRMIALIVAIAALMTALTAQAERTVYVKANSLKVYEKKSTSAKKLTKLNYGESVTYIKKKGKWAKVRLSNGEVGFCKHSGLTKKDPNGTEKTYYAKTDGVKAYKRTSTASAVRATFGQNDKVTVLAITRDGKWYRVRLDEGYGYVKAAKFTKTKTMEPTTVYIAANTVQFYQSASSSSKKVGVMSYGESVTCIKEKGKWAKVRNEKGKTGWCKKSKLTYDNPNGSKETWYAASNVGVYTKPLTSSKKIEKIKEGQSVDVVARTGDGKWMRLSFNGKYGYAKSKKFTDQQPEKEEPEPEPETSSYQDARKGSASAKLEKVIALAVEQYGKKYVYATHGPDTYDCSGLTSYCFGTVAGVALGRSAYSQGYESRFEKIGSISALSRGDVVCFDTVESDIDLTDHVGIYLGGGQFIHASSGAGKVIVSSLTSGYYNRRFSWGMRILD